MNFWYSKGILGWLLAPLALIYVGIVAVRKRYLVRFQQKKYPLPVIIVGNLTVGGVGKTPFVIALAKACLAKGLRPGIVSRGYKAACKTFPYSIQPTDTAAFVGDEPLLIAQETGCPVVIAPKRVTAVEYLLRHENCDLIIADDGLQHYALARDIEIVIVDGLRGFGNGFCCPAGPLRETPSRLKKADFIIINEAVAHPSLRHLKQADTMQMTALGVKQLTTQTLLSPEAYPERFAAITGIGHPQRFFNSLHQLNIKYQPYCFPDHHPFQFKDFLPHQSAVIMTAKDAVKCLSFAKDNWYFLAVEATLSDTFWAAFWPKLNALLPSTAIPQAPGRI